MSLFNEGYDGLEEAQERQKRNGNRIFGFILKEGETDVRFLTEKPVTFDAHTVRRVNNNKEYFETVVCTAKEGHCALCDEGNKPTFKGAYLLYDYGTYINKNKEEVENGLRLYTQGVTVLAQLKRLSEKYGLTDRDITIIRTGKETSTSYSFDRGEKSDFTEDDIRDVLPDAFKEDYDGTEKSLINIVKGQVELLLPVGTSAPNDDDIEDDDYDDTIIGVGDDEEDEEGGLFNNKLRNTRRGSSTKSKGKTEDPKPKTATRKSRLSKR